MRNSFGKTALAALAMLTVTAVLAPVAAQAEVILLDTSNIRMGKHQTETGGDTSANPLVNGAVGSLIPYTVTGQFLCCGTSYLGNNLNDGDIGTGIASDGTYAIPDAGLSSITLSFSQMTTLGSIAIYMGYANRDDGYYTLKDGLGNVLGAWRITETPGNTNANVDSFWLVFNTPVLTDKLVFDTNSLGEGTGTNSYREIQVFAKAGIAGDDLPIPEPASLAIFGLGLAGLGLGLRKRL